MKSNTVIVIKHWLSTEDEFTDELETALDEGFKVINSGVSVDANSDTDTLLWAILTKKE